MEKIKIQEDPGNKVEPSIPIGELVSKLDQKTRKTLEEKMAGSIHPVEPRKAVTSLLERYGI